MKHAPFPLRNWLVVPVFLATPVVYYMTSYHYPLLSPESLLLLLGCMVVGGTLAYLVDIAKSPMLSGAIMSVCLSVALSLIVGMNLWSSLLAPLAIFGILMLLRQTQVIFAFSSIVFALSCTLIPVKLQLPSFNKTSPQVAGDHGPAPILHIVLDAHIGVEGIPAGAGGEKFRGNLVANYLKYGFSVQGGAYSHYRGTADSLSNTFNYQLSEVPEVLVDKTQLPFFLKKNAYFRNLSARGYKIHVYQPAHMNFCDETLGVEFCYTYSNPLAALQHMRLPVLDKLLYLADSFIKRSSYYSLLGRVTRKVDVLTGIDMTPKGFVNHLQPYEAWVGLQELTKELENPARGQVYFAHLILPHHPYLFAEDCSVKRAAEWRDNINVRHESITDEQFQLTYKRYYEQANCVHKTLYKFFDRLQTLGLYNELTILLHGDHGSRVHYRYPSIENKDELELEDYHSAYSIFFAHKSANNEIGYQPMPVPLSQLFYEFSNTIVAMDVEPLTSKKVMLAGTKDGEFVEITYPPGQQ